MLINFFSFKTQSLASIATLYILEYHRRHTNHLTSLEANHNPLKNSYYNNFDHNNNYINNNHNYVNINSRPPSTSTVHDRQSINQSNDKQFNANKGKQFLKNTILRDL